MARGRSIQWLMMFALTGCVPTGSQPTEISSKATFAQDFLESTDLGEVSLNLHYTKPTLRDGESVDCEFSYGPPENRQTVKRRCQYIYDEVRARFRVHNGLDQPCHHSPDDKSFYLTFAHRGESGPEYEKGIANTIAQYFVLRYLRLLDIPVPKHRLIKMTYPPSGPQKFALITQDPNEMGVEDGDVQIDEYNDPMIPNDINPLVGDAPRLNREAFFKTMLALLAVGGYGFRVKQHSRFRPNLAWLKQTDGMVPIPYVVSGVLVAFPDQDRTKGWYTNLKIWHDKGIHPRTRVKNELNVWLRAQLHLLRAYQSSFRPGCQVENSCDHDLQRYLEDFLNESSKIENKVKSVEPIEDPTAYLREFDNSVRQDDGLKLPPRHLETWVALRRELPSVAKDQSYVVPALLADFETYKEGVSKTLKKGAVILSRTVKDEPSTNESVQIETEDGETFITDVPKNFVYLPIAKP